MHFYGMVVIYFVLLAFGLSALRARRRESYSMRVRAASGIFRLPAGRGFGKWGLMTRRGRAKEDEANSRSLWKMAVWRPPPRCGVAEGVIGWIKWM